MIRQNFAIKVSTLDLKRLESLLDSLPADSFPEADLLAAELDRAEVLAPQEMPADVVTMNSRVRFAMEPSGKEYELTLVYPKDIDGSAGKISVLAPVGSALLGLSVGQEIEWPAPGGAMIRVRIIDILYQPERSGDFHR
jgi:regulator of nucleoside diphosphate kinase